MTDEPKNPRLVKLDTGVYTVRDYEPPRPLTPSEVRELATGLLSRVELPAKIALPDGKE
jgi:hypothetical protein